MSKITLDNLSDNLKEYLEGLGLSEEQVLNLINENGLNEEELKAMLKDTMSINELVTSNKTIVGAINELFQNANNGKELIASAIGEPVSAEDTFQAMSTDINGLLSTFKTNMMNNGITVESGDKFKSLIDKIATMVEEGSGKGIQYATGDGILQSSSVIEFTDVTGSPANSCYLEIDDINFRPTVLVACGYSTTIDTRSVLVVLSYDHTFETTTVKSSIFGEGTMNANVTNYKADDKVFLSNNIIRLPILNYNASSVDIYAYYAVGVGEEDTTLRDSLASILQEEGVTVTEEDDMASLITKVDEEFDDNRNKLYTWMLNSEYDVNENMSFDDLLNVLSFVDTTSIANVFVSGKNLFILKTDGTLWAAGYNTYGQLGLGNTDESTELRQVTININNDVKEIIGSSWHTFMIKNDDSLWACGDNTYGQLGLGHNDIYDSSLRQVTTNVNVNDINDIICGEEYTVMKKNDGSLWVCGRNNCGQLGLGDTTDRNIFTQLQ